MELKNHFTEYDKSLILSNQNIATLNHVPIKFDSFIELRSKIDKGRFNFFYPLEILGGVSKCSYMIANPSIVQKELDKMNNLKTVRTFNFIQP